MAEPHASLPQKSGKKHIAIVGAGLAGLTCAYRLKQAGVEAKIFEARKRPGGRVLTARFGSSLEELGGKSLNDGGQALHITNLIKELGLEIETKTIKYDRQKYLGITPMKSLPDFMKHEDFPTLFKRQAQDSKNLKELLQRLFKHHRDLFKYFERTMTAYEGSEVEDLDTSYGELIYFFAKRLFDTAFEWRSIKGGNANLPLALSKRLQGQIFYGHPLTHLSRRDDKIELIFSSLNKAGLFDMVILAIPCSTLREITIQPEVIPGAQLENILSLQYGTNAKILLPVDASKVEEGGFLSPHTVGWLNQDGKILTLYYGGRSGIFDQPTATIMLQREQQFLSHLYFKSATVEMAKDEEVMTDYSNTAVAISWSNHPYSKGSYSNLRPGFAEIYNSRTTFLGEAVRSLFMPVNAQLFFAGEHTTVLEAQGTLEAAVESGERTARQIIKTLTGA